MAWRPLYTYGRGIAPKFRQMTRIALAALLLLAANVQPVFAQNPPSSSPEALNWLQKIAAAPRQL